MSYVLPTFGQLSNIYHGNPLNPMDVPPGALKQGDVPTAILWAAKSTYPTVGFPAGTDFADYYLYAVPDLLEFPAGSGFFYNVGDVFTVSYGFTAAFVKGFLSGIPSH